MIPKPKPHFQSITIITLLVSSAMVFGLIYWRWAALAQAALLIFLTATNWLSSPADRAQVINNWPYISGQQTRDEFLATRVPGYETYIYANKNLPANAFLIYSSSELTLYELRP
jgi:hypothetical protein